MEEYLFRSKELLWFQSWMVSGAGDPGLSLDSPNFCSSCSLTGPLFLICFVWIKFVPLRDLERSLMERNWAQSRKGEVKFWIRWNPWGKGNHEKQRRKGNLSQGYKVDQKVRSRSSIVRIFVCINNDLGWRELLFQKKDSCSCMWAEMGNKEGAHCEC